MTQAQQTGRIPQWTQADRLRKAREMAGLEQQELADLIGVSRSTVSNAERSAHGARQITINAWSLATGVSMRWLRDGTVDTSPDDGPLAQSVELRTFNPRLSERHSASPHLIFAA